MNAERLKEIDEDAIAGKLPNAFTVQSLCAQIRILLRTIEEQRQVIVQMRDAVRRMP
jgi:hypothetical protein